MDKYEVTQAEFEAVMGNDPSRFKGANRPVEKVTWNEANVYCKKVGKRLPTGYEWGKAAKVTNDDRTAMFDSTYAWMRENAGGKTHPVGQKKANQFGLHDMAGNVWEWTTDDRQGRKSLRGGSWFNRTDSMGFYSFDRYSTPTFRNGYNGFRCSQ